MRLGVHNHLVFLIHHCNPVVSLNDSVIGRHLGTVGAGDVALPFVATGTYVFTVGPKHVHAMHLTGRRGRKATTEHRARAPRRSVSGSTRGSGRGRFVT